VVLLRRQLLPWHQLVLLMWQVKWRLQETGNNHSQLLLKHLLRGLLLPVLGSHRLLIQPIFQLRLLPQLLSPIQVPLGTRPRSLLLSCCHWLRKEGKVSLIVQPLLLSLPPLLLLKLRLRLRQWPARLQQKLWLQQQQRPAW
jgi:hypothetical protein